MMIKIKEAIVEKLKSELEYFDKDNKYSQWILSVSIRKERENRIIVNPKYTARVVSKTNESPYVDGIDIKVTVPEESLSIILCKLYK